MFDDYCTTLVKLKAVAQAIRNMGGWGYVEDFNIGYTFQAGNYTAKIVEIKRDPGYPANGYDGAYDQGTTFESYIVVEVDNEFFKKVGTGDSYGSLNWDGDLLPVKVSEKVVKYYE